MRTERAPKTNPESGGASKTVGRSIGALSSHADRHRHRVTAIRLTGWRILQKLSLSPQGRSRRRRIASAVCCCASDAADRPISKVPAKI
jgi:hypothetical protein